MTTKLKPEDIPTVEHEDGQAVAVWVIVSVLVVALILWLVFAK